MKKFLSVLLMSVLLVTTLAVFAMADPEPEKYGVCIGVDSNIPDDEQDENKKMGDIRVFDGGNGQQLNTRTRYNENDSGTSDIVGEVAEGNTVSVECIAEPDYEVGSVAAYWENHDAPEGKENIGVSTNAESNVWTFTMVNHRVFVDILFKVKQPQASPTQAPTSRWVAPEPEEPTNIPSPAYNSNEEEAPQEPQSASTVPTEAPMSVLPANAITFGGAPMAPTGAAYNAANKFSATVLNLEAKDLSNQNGLAAYYAALEGKEPDILASYELYASKDLSAEDNGKLTSLTWKNITAKKLDKNTRIKAVCYNLVDGTYTIEGEIDEFGNIILKNFIIRPAKTNITVFICK